MAPSDPLLPQTIFGVLNTLLYSPSDAVYPINGFPPWMRAITTIAPFTYAVLGFNTLIPKKTDLAAIQLDLMFLLGFAARFRPPPEKARAGQPTSRSDSGRLCQHSRGSWILA